MNRAFTSKARHPVCNQLPTLLFLKKKKLRNINYWYDMTEHSYFNSNYLFLKLSKSYLCLNRTKLWLFHIIKSPKVKMCHMCIFASKLFFFLKISLKIVFRIYSCLIFWFNEHGKQYFNSGTLIWNVIVLVLWVIVHSSFEINYLLKEITNVNGVKLSQQCTFLTSPTFQNIKNT